MKSVLQEIVPERNAIICEFLEGHGFIVSIECKDDDKLDLLTDRANEILALNYFSS